MPERSTSFSADHGVPEERPECVDEDAGPTVPSHSRYDGPETTENTDGERPSTLESESEIFSDKNGRFRSSLRTQEEPMGFVATTADLGGHMAHHDAVGTTVAQRRHASRKRGRRSKTRDRVAGNGKLPLLRPSPLQLHPSWPSVPFSPSSSLTDAHSIYSGRGRGQSKTSSFGVISGPFIQRQGSFRDRHVRPRTAGGSASPTRSAVLIYVTKRSNFDVSGHQSPIFPRSASSCEEDRKRWRNKRSIALSHHHGGAKNRGGREWGGDGATTSTDISNNEVSSVQHHQRPKTAPPDAMDTPSHSVGEGPKTWFRDAGGSRSCSAHGQHLEGLRGGSSTGKNFSNDGHQEKNRPVIARKTAARRIVLAAPGHFSPQDLILSPERAAARLASIRKAYGLENAIRFRGSSLQPAALKYSSSAPLSAHGQSRGQGTGRIAPRTANKPEYRRRSGPATLKTNRSARLVRLSAGT